MTAASDYSDTPDADEAGPVSQRVVAKVAAATDTDPLELDPLYRSIDPDALDRLFGSDAGVPRETEGSVQFSTSGCEVIVRADGAVEVTPQEEEESDAIAPGREADPSPSVPESPD